MDITLSPPRLPPSLHTLAAAFLLFLPHAAFALDLQSPEAFLVILGSGNWAATGLAFFIAGTLLSLTPCVLPLAPIMWRTICGPASDPGSKPARLRGLALSCSFALGMSIFYAAAGVFAAMAGESLAPVLQSSWAILGFSLLLAALGASSLGAFDLRLPTALERLSSALSRKIQGRGLGAAFALGGVSALVAGPCVAPPLAGALAFISQTRDAGLGAFALFCLAWGLCLPIALMGAGLGAVLPKPGPLSQLVQRLFGCALILLAWSQARALMPAAASLALLGALLLFFCARLWPRSAPWRRARLSLCLLLAFGALLEWTGAITGSANPWAPWDQVGSVHGFAAAPSAPAFAKISSLDELARVARASKRPVLLEVSASWCVACGEMRSKTYVDPSIQALLARFELVELDATAMDEPARALMKRFGLFGPPALLAFPAGSDATSPSAKAIGYMEPAALATRLAPALAP